MGKPPCGLVAWIAKEADKQGDTRAVCTGEHGAARGLPRQSCRTENRKWQSWKGSSRGAR